MIVSVPDHCLFNYVFCLDVPERERLDITKLDTLNYGYFFSK